MGRCPMKEATGHCPICDWDDAQETKADLEGHHKGVPRRASREWGRKAGADPEGPLPSPATPGEEISGPPDAPSSGEPGLS